MKKRMTLFAIFLLASVIYSQETKKDTIIALNEVSVTSKIGTTQVEPQKYVILQRICHHKPEELQATF